MHFLSMQVLGTERYMDSKSELVPILIGGMTEMQTSILLGTVGISKGTE